jgi:hypothetical protein
MALSASQRKDARTVIREALKRGASPRELKAVVAAAGVESNYQHDRYSEVGSGDRDSVGILQQRPSMGWGPAGESIGADVGQFLREAKKINRGGFKGSAGQLAQAVQRSAFPGRYDERGGEAESLIRKYGNGKGSTGPVPTGGDQGTTTTTTTGAGFDAGQASALAEMVKQQSRPQAPVSAPSAPAFSAQAPMPAGYQAPSAQPVQSSGGSSLADQLQAIGQLQGQSIPQVDVKTTTTASSQQGASATATPGGGRGGFTGKASGGYKGARGPAQQLAKIGTDLGLKVTSTKRDNQNPYSGSGSDHDNGNKDAFAYDLSNGSQPTPEMDRAAFRIARQLGIKGYKMGQPIMKSVTRGNVRVQLIYRGDGPEFGGNHLNHVHVGVRRVR